MKFIITILLLTIGALAQNTTYKDGTDCECDSIYRTYYDSGELYNEYPIINNNIHGISYMYYKSGRLKSKQIYINNTFSRIESEYTDVLTTYKNGDSCGCDSIVVTNTVEDILKISKVSITDSLDESLTERREYPFKNGMINGIMRSYYINTDKNHCNISYINNIKEGNVLCLNTIGDTLLTGSFKNGLRNGLFQLFYSNGHIKSSGNWKNDKPDGIITSYHKNGNIAMQYTSKNGVLVGTNTIFYENGNIAVKLEFNGYVYEYYENGKLKSKCPTINGKRNGIDLQWDENGDLITKCTFKNDKLNGISYSYDDGILTLQANYKNGVLHGKSILYYHNGNPKMIRNHKNGDLDGYEITYSINGNILTKKQYINGYQQ